MYLNQRAATPVEKGMNLRHERLQLPKYKNCAGADEGHDGWKLGLGAHFALQRRRVKAQTVYIFRIVTSMKFTRIIARIDETG